MHICIYMYTYISRAALLHVFKRHCRRVLFLSQYTQRSSLILVLVLRRYHLIPFNIHAQRLGEVACFSSNASEGGYTGTCNYANILWMIEYKGVRFSVLRNVMVKRL